MSACHCGRRISCWLDLGFHRERRKRCPSSTIDGVGETIPLAADAIIHRAGAEIDVAKEKAKNDGDLLLLTLGPVAGGKNKWPISRFPL
jgi:hypothetical protein